MNRKRLGQIITFYSFKGGVGRTMALANVAFLSALNGHRVLVMDWDLEAPGLAYYFRGLRDPSETRRREETPGMLDLAWKWQAEARNATTETEARSLLHRYQDGEAFTCCIQSLADDHFPARAKLDFIGVGASKIAVANGMSYEDALAHLSWADLIECQGGGLMLDALRSWAKKNYDLILLDSRTGLADAAGICTMQLPDTVALCFALNRQNVDGIAKVAAAIRATRGEEIALRAVPMRLGSNRDTFEGSDAQAYAIRELTRIGGLPRETVREQFQTLAVATADNVPFYETLAPFVPPDPGLDPLTLNYLRLATHLVGDALTVPDFPSEWGKQVRRRLQPRAVTIEYLKKLQDAESSRAVEEIQGLLDNTKENIADELDEEYVSALFTAADNIAFDAEFGEDTTIRSKALDLARSLAQQDREKWAVLLADALEKRVRATFSLDDEEEIRLRTELNSLLMTHQSPETQIRRLQNWQALAALYKEEKKIQSIIDEATGLINSMRLEPATLSEEQTTELKTIEIEFHKLQGNAYIAQGKPNRAITAFETGLRLISGWTPEETSQRQHLLIFQMHYQLACLGQRGVAGRHAIEAVRWLGDIFLRIKAVEKLLRIILTENDPYVVEIFSCHAFGSKEALARRSSLFLRMHVDRTLADIITLMPDIASILTQDKNISGHGIICIVQWCDAVIAKISHRKNMNQQELRHAFHVGVTRLLAVLEGAGMDTTPYAALRTVISQVPSRAARRRNILNDESDNDA